MKIQTALACVLVTVVLSAQTAAAAIPTEDAGPATTTAGRWRCWAPVGVVPCGYPLVVAGLSPEDAWGVGPDGAIMHWDGALWASVASPTTSTLTALDMLSTGDGWAVGRQGVILHWDGTTWTQVDSPTSADLLDVDMLSAIQGWAVGSDGVILRWNGSDWNAVSSSTSTALASISMVSPSDGWAVGANGSMLHWNGIRWIEFFTTPNDLNSVQMRSADDGWAMGDRGTILHWDGGDWWHVDSPTSDDLYDVSMAADTAGWAVGGAFHETSHCGTGYWSNILLRWDGVAWSPATYPVAGRLFTVAMISADAGWASGEDGAILFWNGSGWNATTPYYDRNWVLNDIAMASGTDGWAVGSLTMHWDGTTWAQVDSPVSGALNAIDLVAPDDVWAVGANGTILHWDGQVWSQVASPVDETLEDVDMVSPTDGWAVGWPGSMLRWDGVQWSQVDTETSDVLYGVDMVSSTDGWAVGYRTLLHWDGQAWSSVAGCGNRSRYGVDMVSATDGWIVGGNFGGYGGWEGVVCHWNGESWSQQNLGIWPIRSVNMVSATDGWMTGGGSYGDHYGCTHSGTVFRHWSGTAWMDVNIPSGRQLNAVGMVSSSDGWAVGNGTILRYSEAVPRYRVYLPAVVQ